MSANVRFTDAARWQLQAALATVERHDPTAAKRLLVHVERLARDAKVLEAEGRALPGFPALPHREVRLEGYRLFFRREREVLWIAGIWKARR
jgi:hypothetical protein